MSRNSSTIDATYEWHDEPSPRHVKSRIASVAGEMLLVWKDGDDKKEHR